MWVSHMVKVPSNTSSDGYTFQAFNLTDPDEYANDQNNGAYTNAGIKVVMTIAVQTVQALNMTPSNEWVDVGDTIICLWTRSRASYWNTMDLNNQIRYISRHFRPSIGMGGRRKCD